ncbi:MAG: RpiB/LacA/LacB family sugar-phosphate isomerase [Deltaproteobacteria bacterium]|nr:RpiB/LacA/LacB family sugar-phosphate isomerase [Deltaproteobacteria bacterium]
MTSQIHLKDFVNIEERDKKKALKVGIFSDKDSFFFKEKIGIFLDTQWTSLYDLGPSRIDQYKDILKMADKLAEAISVGKLEYGIALLNENYEIMNVLFNKYKNVRAIFAVNEDYIVNSRRQFNANVLIVKNNSITGDTNTRGYEKEVKLFLETEFDEEDEENDKLLKMISNIENKN